MIKSKNRRMTRVLALMLSLLTMFSLVPSVSMTASASTTIPTITESTPLANNPYMQALFAVGFDKNGWGQAKSSNGTYKMFDYSLWSSFKSNVWTSGITYNLNSSANGLSPAVTSSTTTSGLVNGFNDKGGLCCASFVSYVIFNYLPGKGFDNSKYGKSSEIANLSYVDSWDAYYRKKSGCKVTDVPITGANTTSIQKINLRDDYGAKIGDIVIFGTSSDKTEHIAIYAGRYLSSSGIYYDWVIDLGNSNGPRVTPTVAMYKNGTLMQPTILSKPTEEYGAIKVYKKDPDGNKLSGAKFKVANQSHTFYIGPTDANGYATTGPIVPYGTYTVTETVFPTGYEASGKTSWTVTVGATTQTVTINAVNKKKTGTMKLKKVTNVPVGKDVAFEFKVEQEKDGVWTNYTTQWLTVKKDQTASDITEINDCGTGYRYRIKEVSKDGWTFNSFSGGLNGKQNGDWYEFDLSPGGEITVTANNTLKPGTMKLKKVTDVPASEKTTFEFKVEQEKGGVWTDYTTRQLTVEKDQKESDIIKINDCGADHRYRIKETSCPDDWTLNSFSGGLNGKQNGDWYEFDLRPGGEITVTANNRLQVGTLKLTKTITDNSNLMKKAETFAFKLYSGKTASGTPLREFSITVNTEGKIEGAKWTDTNDPIEIDNENNAAILFKKIKEGWYTVKEVLTESQKAAGWVNASSQTVQVKANSESTVTFDNMLCASSIYIRKTADSMSGSEYKDAFEFAVLGVITDSNGAYVQETQIDNYTDSTAIGGLVGFPGTLIASDISNKIANGYFYRLYLVEFKTQDKYILPTKCSYTLGSNSGELNMLESADLVEVNKAIEKIQTGFAQDKEYVVSECVTLDSSDARGIMTGNNLIFSVHNELQMGQIEIHKTGETFSSVTSADGIYTPVYAENALEGAKFAIFAAEDIIVNGRTVYEKGEQVGGNLVTDENGIAVSEELYLGKYTVKEIDAPDGYIPAEEQTVELTAENTTQRVTTEIVEVYNERVKVKVILPKTMQVVDSNGVKHGENGEIKNVVFGLYANENITAADGKSIPRRGLIETATVNVLGSSANFEFNADLPYGKYYIKEIGTDPAYMLYGITYEFKFSVTDIPADDLTETVEIQLNGIENRALGDIVGLKKDINGELVPGCEFQLYATTEICDAYGNRKYAAGDKVGGTVFSDKNGRFGWSGLYYGTYKIVEVSVPEGYVLPEVAVVTDITINYRNTVQSVEVTNDYTKVSFLKIDENGNPLAGAEFALYRREDYENDSEKAKPIATWVSTTEAKLFEKLAFGDYVVIETEAPQGYTLYGTPEYFTVENSGETIEISLPNRPVLKVLSGGKGFFPQTLVGVALVGLGAILFTYGFRTKKKKTSR